MRTIVNSVSKIFFREFHRFSAETENHWVYICHYYKYNNNFIKYVFPLDMKKSMLMNEACMIQAELCVLVQNLPGIRLERILILGSICLNN